MRCPRRPFINPNDGFFEVLLDYAEELGREQTATARPTSTAEELAAERAKSREMYYAYQLVAQLAFAGVTLDVHSGDAVVLEQLGPVVVNSDVTRSGSSP